MKILFYILISYFAISCTSVDKNSKEEINEKPTNTNRQELDYWSENNCLRGVPTSTLYAKELKKHTFELEKDKGVETAIWENGDSLLIFNKGCEAFLLTYIFYVKGVKLQENHAELVKYCFQKVRGIDLSPIDLEGGINMISKLQ